MGKWPTLKLGPWLGEVESHPEVGSSPGFVLGCVVPSQGGKAGVGWGWEWQGQMSTWGKGQKLAQHPGRAAWGRARGCRLGWGQMELDLLPWPSRALLVLMNRPWLPRP